MQSGPSPADAGADDAPPEWLAELERPLVYFTLGTIFNLESGDLFERVLAGLSGLPVSVVVTVGREVDPKALGPQPGNVRVEQYVPQSLLLPRCDLVVSHAGSGSVVGALAHGLPMVLLPIGADQPLNAARCEALGVARVLDPFHASERGRGERGGGGARRRELPAQRRARSGRDRGVTGPRARAAAARADQAAARAGTRLSALASSSASVAMP